jgi:hypothetical protein
MRECKASVRALMEGSNFLIKGECTGSPMDLVRIGREEEGRTGSLSDRLLIALSTLKAFHLLKDLEVITFILTIQSITCYKYL